METMYINSMWVLVFLAQCLPLSFSRQFRFSDLKKYSIAPCRTIVIVRNIGETQNLGVDKNLSAHLRQCDTMESLQAHIPSDFPLCVVSVRYLIL